MSLDRHRRQYTPINGEGRCHLCGDVQNDQHVPHPWSQVLAWLWDSHPAWKLIIITAASAGTLALALLIAVVRILVTGS